MSIDCEDYKGDTYRNCEMETPGCKCAELDRLRYEADRWKHVAENKWGIDEIAKYQAENDRLRAENAELRRIIVSAKTAVEGRDYRNALAELEDADGELAKEGE